MTTNDELLEIYIRKLKKALKHLEYSYNKILKLSTQVEILDDEALETWESFAARFSRVADIFLTRYLRTCVLINDPGFSGSLRDFVNQGEKLGIIDNADSWMSIRELRNINSHDYSEHDLSEFFIRLRQEAPKLLKINLK
jgi:hypothetical protein